ncbi:unnamed protein product [Brassica rapa]|nr:unnamed protein product [Brassica napus]CAG7888419.1 unnamed protein product [Brassica rapa]VDC75842.1 unnamed protein product [Brassica rapa]
MCCGQVSNIIYLDSPIGVGFSYSKNKSDYDQTSDTKTASDSHNFLIEGYLVGNGVTDPVFDGNGMVPSVHGMGLISDELFEETEAACKGKYYDDNGTYMSDECSHKVGKVIDALGLIDPSNILEPCDVQRSSMSHIAIGSLPVRRKMFRREWPLGILPSWFEFISTSDIPCLDNIVATTWLNYPAVRKAVHTKEKSKIGRWELCANASKYQTDAGSISNSIEISLSAAIALSFLAWTNSMGYKVVDEWRQWMSNDQVAGYTHGYANNLTFLKIKGAGHSVPEAKPREALDFYRRFLAGEKIKTSLMFGPSFVITLITKHVFLIKFESSH